MSEEEQGAGDGLEACAIFVVAGEGEVDDGGAEEEDEGHEAFGEDGEGEGCPHGVGVEVGETDEKRATQMRAEWCRLRAGSESFFVQCFVRSERSEEAVEGGGRGRARAGLRG